ARDTESLRRRLGLPAAGPVNVVIVFCESFRSYELEDPVLGPRLFPHLTGWMKGHGVVFRQAYSSALSAAQTVRGQFATQCSMLPNVGGPATYIAYPGLHVSCLGDVLGKHGYSTMWLSPTEQ